MYVWCVVTVDVHKKVLLPKYVAINNDHFGHAYYIVGIVCSSHVHIKKKSGNMDEPIKKC